MTLRELECAVREEKRRFAPLRRAFLAVWKQRNGAMRPEELWLPAYNAYRRAAGFAEYADKHALPSYMRYEGPK